MHAIDIVLSSGARSRMHQVTLNAMTVLQVQQAMAAQAQTKQKAAEAAIQAKIDAELEKRTKDLLVQTPSWPALTKGQPKKTEDVAQMTVFRKRREV